MTFLIIMAQIGLIQDYNAPYEGKYTPPAEIDLCWQPIIGSKGQVLYFNAEPGCHVIQEDGPQSRPEPEQRETEVCQ